MNLSDRVEKLEGVVVKHLEESGEIRADLKWLKKFMWFVLGTPITMEVIKHLWK